MKEIIDPISKYLEDEIQTLRKMSEEQLAKVIKSEFDYMAPKLDLTYLGISVVLQDPFVALKDPPIMPPFFLHKAIAEILAQGEELPQDVIIWFAEGVRDPSLLNKKAGRKAASTQHHTIKRYIRILTEGLGYGVDEAIIFVSSAVGRGYQYTRNIWYDKKPQKKSIDR